MQNLAKNILQLVLLKQGPQDFPLEKFPGLLLTLLFLIASTLSNGQPGAYQEALGVSIVAVLVNASLLWLLLSWKQFSNRFMQSFTAMIGSGLFFTLSLMPVSHQVTQLQASGQQPSSFIALVFMLFLGWSLSVDAHILRHALSIGRPLSLGLAVLIYLLLVMINLLIFGPVQ